MKGCRRMQHRGGGNEGLIFLRLFAPILCVGEKGVVHANICPVFSLILSLSPLLSLYVCVCVCK